MPVGAYYIKLSQLYEGEAQIGADGIPNFRFVEAKLIVKDQSDNSLGILSPQRRIYSNFEDQTFAEVATRFSLGKEIYAILLGIDQNGRATLAVNINPLVNWLWIGSAFLSIFPFFGLKRVRRVTES